MSEDVIRGDAQELRVDAPQVGSGGTDRASRVRTLLSPPPWRVSGHALPGLPCEPTPATCCVHSKLRGTSCSTLTTVGKVHARHAYASSASSPWHCLRGRLCPRACMRRH